MVNANFYNIELRDKNGLLQNYITPWCSEPNWEWNRIGGCGNCRLKIRKDYRNIRFNARDDIQIRIRSGSTSKLVYRGWVLAPTHSLKIPEEMSIQIKGYFDLLDYKIVHDAGDTKTYSNMSISAIVEDIIDNFVVGNTPITKGTIDVANFSVDTIDFDRDTVSGALRTLAELEGNVEYGVDENLVFFWRKESTTLKHKFFVGYDVASLERKIDWSKLVNKVYFEGGKVNGATYLKSAGADDSQNRYFLVEDVLVNSAITTDSVASQYINSTLKEKSKISIILRAKIPNTSLRLEDSIPLGRIAIYDKDYDQSLYKWGKTASGGDNLIWGRGIYSGSDAIWGALFKDQVDKISYSLSETEDKFNLELTTGGSLLNTAARIKQLELITNNLRQRS
ncbi:MAG: hypothetical protein HY761_10080 [Candidatus Omnitrophica bacterium]|nr:hypothetical protein [Candidatus Omnitrophota bacterium]